MSFELNCFYRKVLLYYYTFKEMEGLQWSKGKGVVPLDPPYSDGTLLCWMISAFYKEVLPTKVPSDYSEGFTFFWEKNKINK